MKLLLTGALSSLHWGMVRRLTRDGHQVSLLGYGIAPKPPNLDAAHYDISPNHISVQQILSTNRFDAVIYFFACHGTQTQAHSSLQGHLLDPLLRIQSYAEENGAFLFFLVTDSRVFGVNQSASEMDVPVPDTANGIMIKAVEDCLSFTEKGSMRTLLIRVTNLYGFDASEGFFDSARQSAESGKPLVLHGSKNSPCDFIHVDDFALFISLVLEEPMTGVVHLAYNDGLRYQDAVEHLSRRLPGLSVMYTGERMRRCMLKARRANAKLGWVPRHDWTQELDEIFEKPTQRRRRKWSLSFASIQPIVKGKVLAWAELALLAVATYFLAQVNERYALFRFVDFWLFFVIFMGSLHGAFIGIMAASVTSVLYGISWIRAGNEAYLLLINVDNWLPIMMYFLCGGLFGHMKSNAKAKLALLKEENAQHNLEVEFIQSMYQQTIEDRNLLQEQVMRSRDSFGKIYAVARELDTLQPAQVFLSTLNIMEDFMQNRSIALYWCVKKERFARLVLHSQELDNRIDRSMDLDALPLLKDCLLSGTLFMNANLDPAYPDVAAPIQRDGNPIALVALWNVPFVQRTLYHQNLLSVLAGMVQSALANAMEYYGASVFQESTIFLSDSAFRSVAAIYGKMRAQGAVRCLLLRVDTQEGLATLAEMAERMQSTVRSTDICGRLENGRYYVLMPQCDRNDLQVIENRFHHYGLLLSEEPLEHFGGIL